MLSNVRALDKQTDRETHRQMRRNALH